MQQVIEYEHKTKMTSVFSLIVAVACTAVTLKLTVFDHWQGIDKVQWQNLAVILVTIWAGHGVYPNLRKGSYPAAFALLAVFLAGTFFIVASSAGRTASYLTDKAVESHNTNKERDRIEKRVAAADAALKQAREAMTKECASGAATLCAGKTHTFNMAKKELEDEEKKLKDTPPRVSEDTNWHWMADVLASFNLGEGTDLEGRTKSNEVLLGKLMPGVVTLITEFATILAFSVAFTVRVIEILPPPAPPVVLEPLSPRQLPAPRRDVMETWTMDEAFDDVMQSVSMFQKELPERWRVQEHTVSRWVSRWAAEGKVSVTKNGKMNIIAPIRTTG